MSRRSRAEKRETPPDPRFESRTVTKFINNLMLDGKKSVAEKIFYDAVEILEQRTGQPGVQVFEQALTNCKPALEVKSRRVGGATYQVPIEVRPERRAALATLLRRHRESQRSSLMASALISLTSFKINSSHITSTLTFR